MLKKAVFFSLILLILTGCGGGGTSSSSGSLIQEAEDNSTTSQEETINDGSQNQEGNSSIGDENSSEPQENNTEPTTNEDDNTTTVNEQNSPDIYTLEELLEEPYLTTQWGIFYDEEFFTRKNINTSASINGNDTYLKYTGNTIRVAVIDDGFDTDHPEFQGRIHSTHNFSRIGSSTDVSHTSSSDSHGTAVAGIIGANMDKVGIRGVAPEVELILIKYAESSTDQETIEMFQTAVNNGADIINCSWGTGAVTDSVAAYLEEISQTGRNGKGIIVVFASGNDSVTMEGDESALPSVIGVGATDQDNLRVSYSNYGPELDVMAPGGGNTSADYGISTLDPTSSSGSTNYNYNLYNESTGFFSGTSAAAPVLSGALALLLQSDNSLTFTEVFEKLQNSSDKISENVPYVYDIESYGSSSVRVSGVLGSSGYNDFNLRITSLDDLSTQENNITVSGSDWYFDINLTEGRYKAELVSYNKTFFGTTTNYLATDEEFEVDTTKETVIKGLRNDYYGYGKVNLSSLIN